jgi:hypothetical protein
MEYVQYQLHVSASTMAIIRLAFNLSRDYKIRMVYSGGGGRVHVVDTVDTTCTTFVNTVVF